MGENSKIEWTDHTFNPWVGCTKVAAGCANCYAESLSKRTGMAQWGPNGTRVKTTVEYWRKPLKWNREAEKDGVRRRVFCASLADVFEDWKGRIVNRCGDELCVCHGCGEKVLFIGGHRCDSPKSARLPRRLTIADLRRDLFALIDQTPWLDWLLLTKRPENIRRMLMPWLRDRSSVPNLWLGTSVATQEDADTNIPAMVRCRDLAPVLFLSCEPLLGLVDLTRIPTGHWSYGKVDVMSGYLCGDEPDEMYDFEADGAQKPAGEWERGEFGIDWVIVGGESGPNARPMHPDWARSIRDQCQAAGVPFFFKQWGEWGPAAVNLATGEPVFRVFENAQQWTNKASTWVNGGACVDLAGAVLQRGADFETATYPVAIVHRVGKKAAGRLLDGREWNEFPGSVGSN